MEVEWETFRHLDPNVPQLQALLAEFEMHTLAKRLLPSEGEVADWGGGSSPLVLPVKTRGRSHQRLILFSPLSKQPLYKGLRH